MSVRLIWCLMRILVSLKKDDQINIRCSYLYKIKGITDVKLTFLKTVGIKIFIVTKKCSARSDAMNITETQQR